MKEKQGNLAKTGLPKLLHMIYNEGAPAGILDIIRDPIKKRFYFKDGLPVAASSNVLNEVLGRLLMQEGIISQKDYERSLETVLREKKKHGSVLISMGLLTTAQLDNFLLLQLKSRLLKIFGWNEGTYRYIKADRLPEGITQFPLHPAALILEGITLGFYPDTRMNADLMEYLNRPVNAAVDPGRYALDDFRLNLQEKRFFETFDGAKTLKECIEGSDLLRHRALSLALSFITTGLLRGPETEEEAEEPAVEIREAKAAEASFDSRLNAELLFMRAKSALLKKDYRDAIDTLKEITDLNPTEGEYWAYLGWAVYKENPRNIKEAEKIIKDALDLNNELDSAWYFLGRIFLASGDIDGAEKALRTAVAKNPWMLDSLAELKRLEIKKSLKTPEDESGRLSYMEFYSFIEDPFTDSPQARYLATSGSQSRALEFLVRSIKKKTGPMLLEGVKGAGKTTVALELLKNLSNEKVLCAFILRPQDGELKLIKAINAEVGAASESSSIKEQLLSLGMRVSQNKIQSGTTVVIIDEAHLLAPGCLKLIQYLSRLKTLHIVLLAEPIFSERLKEPDFKELDQKLAARFTMSPLTLEETGEFISKRLKNALRKAASAPLELTLTDDAIGAVYRESGGVPAEINKKSALLLSKASTLNANVLDKKAIDAAFKQRAEEKEEALIAQKQVEAFVEKAFEEEGVMEKEAAFVPLVKEGPGERPEERIEGPLEERIEKPIEKPTERLTEEPVLEAAAGRVEAPEIRIDYKPARAQGAGSVPAAAAKKEPVGKKEKKGRSVAALIIWVVAMVIAGLIVGSLIGIFLFGREETPPQKKGTGAVINAPAPSTEKKEEATPAPPAPEKTGAAENAPPEADKVAPSELKTDKGPAANEGEAKKADAASQNK